MQAHYHADEVLQPYFTGNADYIDGDDIFAPPARRVMWFAGFPVLERPPDELEIACNYIIDYEIM